MKKTGELEFPLESGVYVISAICSAWGDVEEGPDFDIDSVLLFPHEEEEFDKPKKVKYETFLQEFAAEKKILVRSAREWVDHDFCDLFTDLEKEEKGEQW